VNPRFDQDESKLRIFVFSVALKMLAHGDRLQEQIRKKWYGMTKDLKDRSAKTYLLDKEVQIFGNRWCKT
jgi:hypothetical protein